MNFGRQCDGAGAARRVKLRSALILFLALVGLLWTFAGRAEQLPPLPVAHSNNAVAKVGLDGDLRFYSFMGLRAGKTHADISKQAFEYDVAAKRWRALPDVPVDQGRLASAAVGIGDLVYLFGGYSVAADGTEVSTPEVFCFDPEANAYSRRQPIPVPVDDTVALPYGNRYIYLISGWHDKDSVQQVQVYDTIEDRWFRATDWPGRPVFGHAGGILGNRMVVADGVTVLAGETGSRRFKLVGDAWSGEIDPTDPSKIGWKRLPSHPGNPLYRMAATGSPVTGGIVFGGGSETAYNYNGNGYDGTPAIPSARAFAFDVNRNRWVDLGSHRTPSMDHRGLLEAGGVFYTLGGMGDQRQVIGDIIPFTVEVVDALGLEPRTR